MPKIKIERIISFSSEDSVHVANNILSNDPAKKWKCQTVGEKSANLVLQLEEAAVISNIDIGNEHSAYIEVLVSRSCSDENYKALLVMSSFMTPLESRQSLNVNKVRMFTHDQLSAPERDEKWDRVKIVCTQPFNRHVQYGLSFVTFHTTGKEEGKPQAVHIGNFTLRPESPNNVTVGSLFARKQELGENKPLTAAAAIREASLTLHSPSRKKIKLPETVTSATTSNDTTTVNASRKRDEIFYDQEDERPNEKIDFIMEQKKLEKEKVESKHVTPMKPVVKQNEKVQTIKKKDIVKNNTQTPRASTSKDAGLSRKRKSVDVNGTPNKKTKQLKRPFHQLLSDVVVVISGIQNPERGNIRCMVLTMGGKYKTDWDNTCTHLICAFTNTPKFNQVKGKGKIVAKDWILDCYNKRKKLPWRKYALDKNDKGKDESEEEILEETKEPEETKKPEEIPNDYDDNREIKSGSDTEDEMERIKLQQSKDTEIKKVDTPNQEHDDKQHTNKNGCSPTRNVFDCDTEEEVISKADGNPDLPSLPNLFEGKLFYIDRNLSNEERRKLFRYITACNGSITTFYEDTMDYIITTEEFKLELDEILEEAVLVHPNFIYECYNSKILLPYQDFVVP